MRPVLEIRTPDGFGLWPVAGTTASGFLALGGDLSPAEVGTAVMCVADCNDIDPDGDRPPRPADPLAAFLHGLLAFDDLFAAGGLRVTDGDVTFAPGCCDGLEDWRDWYRPADHDGLLGFGHDPVSPVAERVGDRVRLTVDAERSDSPVIELPASETPQSAHRSRAGPDRLPRPGGRLVRHLPARPPRSRRRRPRPRVRPRAA